MSPETDDIGPVLAHLESAHERILGELIAFAAIPSVSVDPACATDVEAASRWVTHALRSAGPMTVRTIVTPGHPVIYGEWLGAPGKPTVLVYGHYDVRPPQDERKRPAFTPIVRDGRLHAHGASHDKGPMLIPIKVAESFLVVRGTLPLNVKFLIEGDEEAGSPNLEALVRQHCEMLGADVVLCADGEMGAVDDSRARAMDADSFALRAADAALHAAHGTRDLVVRIGGNLPVARAFRRHMGLDTVFLSFSTAGDDIRAATEYLHLDHLHEGLNAWARFWDTLGTMLQ